MHSANEEYSCREHTESDRRAAKPDFRLTITHPSSVILANGTQRQGRASMYRSLDGRVKLEADDRRSLTYIIDPTHAQSDSPLTLTSTRQQLSRVAIEQAV